MNTQDESIDRRWSSRALAIAEPLFLLVAISLIAAQLAHVLGLANREDRNAILFDGTPDWLAAAIAESEWLGLRFGLTLLAAWVIAAWRGGPTRREASLSAGGHSVLSLIAMGIGVCLIMMAPVRAAMAIDAYYPLGERTPMWQLLAQTDMMNWQFWLFMAASSFVIVPIVEELFFRAYMLGRFRENFSAGGATLLTSVLFWVSHGQYMTGDPYLAFHAVWVLVGAIVMAWMTLKTGSLIPTLTAHVLFNIPGQFAWNAGWVVVALIVLIAWRATMWRYLKEIFALLATTREWLFLLVAAITVTALAIAIRAEPSARLALIGLFLLFFILSVARRRRRA